MEEVALPMTGNSPVEDHAVVAEESSWILNFPLSKLRYKNHKGILAAPGPRIDLTVCKIYMKEAK